MKSDKVGIFLILCIMVPLVGAIAGLQLKKTFLKRRGRKLSSKADKENAVLLKFTKEESQSLLNWEHEREFEYKGYMYDVIDSEVDGDTVSYWCLKDYKETQLNRELDEVFAFLLGKKDQKKETHQRLTQFLKSLYFSTPQTFSPVVHAEKFTNILSTHYSSVCISPAVPPPKLG